MGQRSNGEGLSWERKEPRVHHSNLGTGCRFGQKSERAPKIGGSPGLMLKLCKVPDRSPLQWSVEGKEELRQRDQA